MKLFLSDSYHHIVFCRDCHLQIDPTCATPSYSLQGSTLPQPVSVAYSNLMDWWEV